MATNFKSHKADQVDKFLFINDILKYGDENISNLNKQFRKNPYTYLFNSSWEDEIMNEVEEQQSNPYVDAQKLKAYNLRMGTNYQTVEELRMAND